MANKANCYFYRKGKCTKGKDCLFKHNPNTVTQKPLGFSIKQEAADYIALDGDSADESVYSKKGNYIRTADEVVNIKKEPIAIDLKIHNASPDHRYIRQAPVKKLDRKISIPKSHLDLYYSAFAEDIHVKSLHELQMEKIVQEQYKLEKRKHFNKIAELSNKKRNLKSMKQPAHRKNRTSCRKLISNNMVEVRLNGVEGDTNFESSIADEIHSVTPSNPRVFVDFPQSDSANNGLVSNNGAFKKSPILYPGNTDAAADEPHYKSHPYNTTIVGKACNGNVKTQRRNKVKQVDGSVKVPSQSLKASPNTCTSGSSKVMPRRQQMADSSVMQSAPLRLPSSMSLVQERAIRKSSSEHAFRPPDAPSGSVDIQTNSAACWQNYGRSMSDHNISRISLDRLNRCTDNLNGVAQTSTPTTGQHSPVVFDLLNISHDELRKLAMSRNIKSEPVSFQEPTTPTDSLSDDDITWDDDHASTEVEGDNSSDEVLEIHEEDTSLDEGEQLMDRADELLA